MSPSRNKKQQPATQASTSSVLSTTVADGAAAAVGEDDDVTDTESPAESLVMALRCPIELIREVDAYVLEQQEDLEARGMEGMRVTRSGALRALVKLGLRAQKARKVRS